MWWNISFDLNFMTESVEALSKSIPNRNTFMNEFHIIKLNFLGVITLNTISQDINELSKFHHFQAYCEYHFFTLFAHLCTWRPAPSEENFVTRSLRETCNEILMRIFKTAPILQDEFAGIFGKKLIKIKDCKYWWRETSEPADFLQLGSKLTTIGVNGDISSSVRIRRLSMLD